MELATVVREKGGNRLEVAFGDAEAWERPRVTTLSLLRERWHVPLRVLALWGNYHKATVLESMGGLLRVDFGGGTVRWALTEETLRSSALTDDELVPGLHVGADTEGDGAAYARGMLLGEAEEGEDMFEVMREDGQGAVVARSALRAPRGEERDAAEEGVELAEGAEVYAVYGEWTLGFVNDIADADAAGRVQAVLTAGGRRWSTTLAARELVRRFLTACYSPLTTHHSPLTPHHSLRRCSWTAATPRRRARFG